MTPAEYVEKRVDQYMKWYDGKAVRAKARYLQMRAFSVVGGGLVPVLVNVNSQYTFLGASIVQWAVTIVSLLVAVCVSLESVFHYREQWKNYRTTEQLLGHETFLYQSRVGRYRELEDDEAFRLFVERVEEAIAIENSATLSVMTMANETFDSIKHAKPGEASLKKII